MFKFSEGRLCTLLVSGDDKSVWSIPSLLMRSDESASETAARLVHHFTGVRGPYLDQVFTFADATRLHSMPSISITYIALINGLKDNRANNKATWVEQSQLPSLIVNDDKKVREAIAFVRRKATYDPLYFELLPSKFTLPQLRKLFEEIYGESFDQRNFNKKFKALGLLIKLGEKETTQSRKGAFYYMFDREKYDQMERPALRFAHLLY